MRNISLTVSIIIMWIKKKKISVASVGVTHMTQSWTRANKFEIFPDNRERQISHSKGIFSINSLHFCKSQLPGILTLALVKWYLFPVHDRKKTQYQSWKMYMWQKLKENQQLHLMEIENYQRIKKVSVMHEAYLSH